MSITGNLRWDVFTGECPKGGGLCQPVIFDDQVVKLWLQLKVAEEQVDPAARLRDDEPHTVHVVAILFWVVRGKDGA